MLLYFPWALLTERVIVLFDRVFTRGNELALFLEDAPPQRQVQIRNWESRTVLRHTLMSGKLAMANSDFCTASELVGDGSIFDTMEQQSEDAASQLSLLDEPSIGGYELGDDGTVGTHGFSR